MKKAGILIATFLLIASMMTACGCTGTVEGDTTPNSTTSTTASTTRSTAPTTVPPTTQSTAPSETATRPTDEAITTPKMGRNAPMSMD